VPPAQQQPQPPQQPSQPSRPDELPPAGPGDGRTPLFDTLETNWFQQQQSQQAPPPAAPEQQRPQPSSPLPSRTQPQNNQAGPPRPASTPAPASNGTGGGNGGANGGHITNGSAASWRTSPNDELGRQAERVKQPSAGGVTTSGLPRRVPRANLVAGTAQQQQDSTGPQVSRAPEEVRGRLTNLRRGIQQGRQAGTGQTGSFPTHQQER
jgi:hypothetical protein